MSSLESAQTGIDNVGQQGGSDQYSARPIVDMANPSEFRNLMRPLDSQSQSAVSSNGQLVFDNPYGSSGSNSWHGQWNNGNAGDQGGGQWGGDQGSQWGGQRGGQSGRQRGDQSGSDGGTGNIASEVGALSTELGTLQTDVNTVGQLSQNVAVATDSATTAATTPTDSAPTTTAVAAAGADSMTSADPLVTQLAQSGDPTLAGTLVDASSQLSAQGYGQLEQYVGQNYSGSANDNQLMNQALTQAGLSPSDASALQNVLATDMPQALSSSDSTGAGSDSNASSSQTSNASIDQQILAELQQIGQEVQQLTAEVTQMLGGSGSDSSGSGDTTGPATTGSTGSDTPPQGSGTPGGNTGSGTTSAGGGDSGSGTTTSGGSDSGSGTTTSGGSDSGSGTTTSGGSDSGSGTTTSGGSDSGSGTTTSGGSDSGSGTTTSGGSDSGSGTTTSGGNDSGSTQTTASGQFQVENGQIIGPDGQPFIIKGMNIDAPGLSTALANVDNLANNWDINQVRIDDYSNGIDIMDANGNPNFQELNTIVNAFTSKGIVVQLDGSNPQAGIFSGQSLAAQENFYQQAAAYYKNNPYVWFGTSDEAGGSGGNTPAWLTETTGELSAIRGTGNTNPIVVDDTDYSSASVNEPGQSGLIQNASTLLPYGNLIGAIHAYSDSEGDIESGASALTQAGYAPFVEEYGEAYYGSNGWVSDSSNPTSVIAAGQANGIGMSAYAIDPTAGPDDVMNPNGTPGSTFGQEVYNYYSGT